MKFSAKHDIDAPAAYVFSALSDFDAWELMALRRGVEVTRTDKLARPAAGMGWQVAFTFRGRARKADLRLVNLTPSTKMEFAAMSQAMDATLVFDIVEMSAKRARVHVIANITPLTLTAKLFIQSLRLARTRAERKFTSRVQAMMGEIEARYQADQKPA